MIYTDGVTEAQNSQAEFFARQRLRKLVEAHPADSLPGTAPCGGGRHCRVYGVRAAGRWHHTGGDFGPTGSALARGMQSFLISAARLINSALSERAGTRQRKAG